MGSPVTSHWNEVSDSERDISAKLGQTPCLPEGGGKVQRKDLPEFIHSRILCIKSQVQGVLQS